MTRKERYKAVLKKALLALLPGIIVAVVTVAIVFVYNSIVEEQPWFFIIFLILVPLYYLWNAYINK